MRESYPDFPGLEIFSVHVRVTMTSGWAGTIINDARWYAMVQFVGDGSITKLVCDSDGTLDSVCTQEGWLPVGYS